MGVEGAAGAADPEVGGGGGLAAAAGLGDGALLARDPAAAGEGGAGAPPGAGGRRLRVLRHHPVAVTSEVLGQPGDSCALTWCELMMIVFVITIE